MKTLTFIVYFVTILGLIEANWRVTDHSGFSSREKSIFKRYVRSAMSQSGNNGDKMEFLTTKMIQKHGGDWSCFCGRFDAHYGYHKFITVTKGNNDILCFQ